jgi:hypothetical protein
MFIYSGSQFQNLYNKKVLDVSGGKDVEGQNVIVWKSHGGVNQRWRVVYLDKAEKEQTTGLNKEFGMHCNRPFYLVSRLWMKRVAECQGASNVFLKRYRANQAVQQWYFDCKTKTIRSNYWKNYAMQIPGNGGQNELRMISSITSRWW